jgi:hypothetical protein
MSDKREVFDRLNALIPKRLKQEAKIKAIKENRTLTDVLIELLEKYIKK